MSGAVNHSARLVPQIKAAILAQDPEALRSLVVDREVGTLFPLWTKHAGPLKIPLAYAFRRGKVRAFEKLLELGHDINVEVTSSAHGKIPLLYGVILPIGHRGPFLDAALRHGLDLERAKKPIAEGRSFLSNILHLSTAADIREQEVWVEHLAVRFEKLGVPIDVDNNADFDCSLLFFVVVEGSVSLLKFLREKGVDLNANFATLDTNAFTVAFFAKRINVCLWLLDNGAIPAQHASKCLNWAARMVDAKDTEHRKNISVLRSEIRARLVSQGEARCETRHHQETFRETQGRSSGCS